MNYDISVIIPVYNAENYIKKCLDSIMHQTVNTMEIICVNDGSRDGSLAVLRDYQRENRNIPDREIIVIDQANGGPSAARNRGLAKASGKYIGFVDSDDYIEPNMYQNLIHIAEEQHLEAVLCNIMNSYDDRHIPSEIKVPCDVCLTREQILKLICPTLMTEDIFGGPCNRIYSREFLVRNHIRMPEQLGYGEDAVFQMQVFDLLQSTWFDSHAYYHYVHREGTQSSAKPGRLESTLEPLYRIRCEYGDKWGIDRQMINNYFLYCAIMDLLSVIKSSAYRKKWKYFKCFFVNKSVREALADSNITKEMSTNKIFMVYKMLKHLF